MSHQETYRHNETLAQVLADWDPTFYQKYIDTLHQASDGGRALDVGCGVGRVVGALRTRGVDACGVDVSEANIQRATQSGNPCQFYDGRRLPFEAGVFNTAGAQNVLEHVEDPVGFLTELVRVIKPLGTIVISSPNFLRSLGYKDYHRHMRGFSNKWNNWKRMRVKHRAMKQEPDSVEFDRMTPIFKEPFEPDDDAIIATNGPEIAFFLKRLGCEVLRIECTDRYVPKWLDLLLNATPLRFHMLNTFIVARKME